MIAAFDSYKQIILGPARWFIHEITCTDIVHIYRGSTMNKDLYMWPDDPVFSHNSSKQWNKVGNSEGSSGQGKMHAACFRMIIQLIGMILSIRAECTCNRPVYLCILFIASCYTPVLLKQLQHHPLFYL